MNEWIRQERDGDVTILTLINPPLNLTTLGTLDTLAQIASEIASDTTVRAVVITGDGQRAFCAGSDVSEFPDLRADIVERKLSQENAVFTALEDLPVPVIAAINATALGGGVELALACDLRVIDEHATIGFPEINLGVYPGSGGTFRLPRIVGQSRALDLLLTGRRVDASEALSMGLVQRIAPSGGALGAAMTLAKQLAAGPADAMWMIKREVHTESFTAIPRATANSLHHSAKVFRGMDLDEGLAAFFGKRPPHFTARRTNPESRGQAMLDGVKVVALTHYLQGPACVQYLADLGADVIKIEAIGGAYERFWAGAETFRGDESIFFQLAGRNQRSIEIDLRAQGGSEVLWRLLEQADVVVENFRPGALERRGFGYDAVTQRNPSVVYCSLSGFGPKGPLRDRPGQDLLVQSLSGLAMLSGRAQDPPTPVGTALVDQHAAALGAMGILAALMRRERTGEGAKVDSNLLSAALDLQIEPANYHLNGHLYDRSASGISSRFHQAPYGVFATADGWLTLSLSDGPTLAEALAEPRLAEVSRADQFRNREGINELVAARLGERSTSQWQQILSDKGIWNAPVRDYDEVFADPQVHVNGSVMTYEHPRAGTISLLAHPVAYDGVVPPMRRIPPDVGEHTDEVLAELGYEPEAVGALRASGSIGPDRAVDPVDLSAAAQRNLYSRRENK